MLLVKCEDFNELTNFLKLDYANNLYFFTYLTERAINPNLIFLIAKHRDKIVLTILLTSVHCCITSLDAKYIYAIADQLPPINSIHIVGRKDLVEHLLKVSNNQKRDNHIESFCVFNGKAIFDKPAASQKATASNLDDLIHFYNNNDMLLDAESRLPAILSWGKAYFIQKEQDIVSCALTTTETNDAAMIGAVYTTPTFRNNGFSKDCILNLCQELVLQHKKPYLFYESNNVLLVSLYESLGFCQTNTWMLATRKQY
ncbi:MAG: GNAT family N-acetyltransferase [Oscillospiraceae bacterium]